VLCLILHEDDLEVSSVWRSYNMVSYLPSSMYLVVLLVFVDFSVQVASLIFCEVYV
jgi:hypothetical protein